MIETKDPERVVVDTAVQEKAPTAIESLLDLPTRGCRTAPELSAGGQARRHHGLALHTRFSSSAPGGTEVPAHAARPRRPRPSPQDRGQPSARRPLGPATRSRVACAPSRAASARAEDPFVARPQGASAAARLGLPSLAATPVTAPKGGQFLLHAKALDDKSLRRLYNRSRHRQSRKACTGYRPRHPQRQGLSRSQLSRPVQGLYQRPGPAYHQRRSPRDATPSCRGTRDRPSPRKITVWVATIARAATATASTRFSPPLATTSAHSCASSGAYYTACS
jgi:hypothetical protein